MFLHVLRDGRHHACDGLALFVYHVEQFPADEADGDHGTESWPQVAEVFEQSLHTLDRLSDLW